MDFPVFEMPFLGGRWLIGLVAILHVLINHGAAIGGSFVVVMLERKGLASGDSRWERLAYRLAFAFFLLTTTLGAMSGVGIWFTTMVAEPAAIGTMLRIFFWGWFTEWLVFILEIVLVMAYFLSWDHFREKRTHLRLGYLYAGCSFATLAIITGILGAMLTPGRWLASHGFWNGFLNPSYVPQVILRTGLALGLAAIACMFLSRWLAPESLRDEASRYLSRFLLAAMPLVVLGGALYLWVLPGEVRDLIPTALVTLQFTPYVQASYVINGLVGLALLALGGWGTRRARAVPWPVMGTALLAIVMLLGQFERVREFVRKPYMIHGYLYANGIRVDEAATFDRDGILPHARFAAVHTVTPENRLVAGHEVYKLECAACHTLGGLNDLRAKVVGENPAAISMFVAHLHDVHPFMPPFIGTPAERDALAAFLAAQGAPTREAHRPNAVETP